MERLIIVFSRLAVRASVVDLVGGCRDLRAPTPATSAEGFVPYSKPGSTSTKKNRYPSTNLDWGRGALHRASAHLFRQPFAQESDR